VFAIQIVTARQNQLVWRRKSHECGCHSLLLTNRLEISGALGIGGYC
jgi:hypothetical protein